MPDEFEPAFLTSMAIRNLQVSENKTMEQVTDVEGFMDKLEAGFIPLVLDITEERKAGAAMRAMARVMVSDLARFTDEQNDHRMKIWIKSAEVVAYVMEAKHMEIRKDLEAAVMHPDVQKMIEHYTVPGPRRDGFIDAVAQVAKTMNDIIHTSDSKAEFTKVG